MKKAVATILASCLLVTGLLVLFACNDDGAKDMTAELNAEFYDRATGYMDEEYLLSQPSTEYLGDETTIVVMDREMFSGVFAEFPGEVDFSREMLVVHLFNDIYNGFECRLTGITLQDGALEVSVLHSLAPKTQDGLRPPSTSQPTQRAVVIKLDKVDFSQVTVDMTYEE